MLLHEAIAPIEQIAPAKLQESFDNSGLILGHPEMEVSGALITLDVTEKVIDEAIDNKLNLIIAHHPLIFKPLSQITGKDETERAVIKALKSDIAVYASHTNLDISTEGVNTKLGKILGLKNMRPINDKEKSLLKIEIPLTEASTEKVRSKLTESGLVFNDHLRVLSTGAHNQAKIEAVFPFYLKSALLEKLSQVHPKQNPFYEISTLDTPHPDHGLGMVGSLSKPHSEEELLDLVKSTINCQQIRYSPLKGRSIEKVAVCGGAGAGFIKAAAAKGAQAFITSDVKYHQFFEASDHLLLIDAGHYETEYQTMELIENVLHNKMPNFVVQRTRLNTNPVNYY